MRRTPCGLASGAGGPAVSSAAASRGRVVASVSLARSITQCWEDAGKSPTAWRKTTSPGSRGCAWWIPSRNVGLGTRPRGSLRNARRAVPLHLVLDRAGTYVEDLRGSRRRTSDGLERPQDGLLLDLLERRTGDGRAAGPARRRFGSRQHGEEREPQEWRTRQHHRPLDGVLQLAYVAGPVVGHERHKRLVVDALDLLAVERGALADEILDEERDVLGSGAQGRQRDLD